MSPTQRTLAYLRKLGWRAYIVEKFIKPPFRPGFHIDFAGFADILAYRRTSSQVLAVQTTSGGNHAAHLTKYRTDEKVKAALLDWLYARQNFWIMSWSKVGPRGKRKTWAPRIQNIKKADLGCR